MIRWLCFVLVAVNLAYLGWNLWRPAPAAISMAQQSTADLPTLRLLTEAPESVVSAPGDAEPQAQWCWVAGPWPDAQQARGWWRQAMAADADGWLQSVKVRKEGLHWVYLAAADTPREQVVAQLKELQAQGVDSFLVSDGDDAGAISFGYFSSEESARGLAMTLRSAGHAVEMRPTVRELTEYWYFLPGDAVGAGRLQLAAVPPVRLSRASCGED